MKLSLPTLAVTAAIIVNAALAPVHARKVDRTTLCAPGQMTGSVTLHPANPPARGTGLQLRLSGYSYYAYGVLRDSSNYYYSGANGHSISPRADIMNFGLDDGFDSRDGWRTIMCDSFVSRKPAGGILQVQTRKSYPYRTTFAVDTALLDDLMYIYTNRPGSGQFHTACSRKGVNGQYAPYSDIYRSIDNISGVATDSICYADTPDFRRVIKSVSTPTVDTVIGYIVHITGVRLQNLERIITRFTPGLRLVASVDCAYKATDTDPWEPTARYTYTYDQMNRALSSAHDIYLPALGTWQFFERDTTGYTGASHIPTSIARYEWQPARGWFGFPDKRTYTLDAQENRIAEALYHWDEPGRSWKPAEQNLFAYNADGYPETVKGYKYDTVTGTYASIPYDVNTYYYERFQALSIAGNSGNAAKELAVWPNPARDALYVSVGNAGSNGTILIADYAGRALLRQPFRDGIAQLSIGHFPAGIYLIQAFAADQHLLGASQVLRQ